MEEREYPKNRKMTMNTDKYKEKRFFSKKSVFFSDIISLGKKCCER